MNDISTFISSAVNQVYDSISTNGKPKLDSEYTVLAGIVALVHSNDRHEYLVLSLATGTKCIGDEYISSESCIGSAAGGRLVHDSHAEVLAKRGFQRFLSKTLRKVLEQPGYLSNMYCPIEENPTKASSSSSLNKYRMKSNWELFLYVSDSPCGDACIYRSASGDQLYTGAKLVTITSDSSISIKQTDLCIREEGGQVLGQIRMKSGRSDIVDRSSSMSCSDKICRWITLGLQGSILYSLCGKMSLSGVVVGRDPAANIGDQLAALERALITRLSTIDSICQVYVLETCQFINSKSYIKSKSMSAKSETSSKYPVDNIKMEDMISSEDKVTVGEQEHCYHPQKKRRHGASLQYDLPCSTSINWQRDVDNVPDSVVNTNNQKVKIFPQCCKGTTEITIARSGLPQGSLLPLQYHHQQQQQQQPLVLAGKEKSNRIKQQLGTASRLSRFHMLRLYQDVCTRVFPQEGSRYREDVEATGDIGDKEAVNKTFEMLYTDFKSQINNLCKDCELIAQKERFFSHPTFSQWYSIKSKVESPEDV